jgi:hypothetical protein
MYRKVLIPLDGSREAEMISKTHCGDMSYLQSIRSHIIDSCYYWVTDSKVLM